MADPKIRIKRSAVAGRIPSVDQVPLGELALNTWDGQLYASKNVGLGTTVVAINPWLVGTGTDSYNAYFTAGNIGIGSTTPTSALHVVGDAYVSGVVTANAGFNLGISSGGSVITSGPIKTLNFIGAGNTFLVNGTTVDISIQGGGGGGGAEIGVQANDSVIGYAQTTLNFIGSGVTGVSIGTTTIITIEPGLVGAAKSVTSFTATAGQTTFNVNYSQGQENVFRNGIRLSEGGDYTATNGSTVVLTSPASDGDQIDVVVYLRGSDPQRNINVSLSPPFNGITTAFTMYSAGAVFSPVDERQIIVSLGGVVQQPGVAYTVGTGSSIYFSAAPGAATTCFITALYSYTSSNTSLNVAGGYGDLTNLNVSGISTLGTVKVSSGVVTATSGIVTYYGDGSKLSGIQAGYFTQNTTGIHTLGSIGIGTTNPTSKLTVTGDSLVTGVITANSFSGEAFNAYPFYVGLTSSIFTTPTGVMEPVITFSSDSTKRYIVHSINVSNRARYQPVGAAATVTVGASGTITNITLNFPGSNYRVAPDVSIASTVGSGATITSRIDSDGRVIGFTILYAGTGYESKDSGNVVIANPGLAKTDVGVSVRFDRYPVGGGTTVQSYIAYNTPIPAGGVVEVLKQPQVMNPSDVIQIRGHGADGVGLSSAVDVLISYEEIANTNYIGFGTATPANIGIGTTIANIKVFDATSYPFTLQSLRLTNTEFVGDYDVSIKVVTGAGQTYYLARDLIIPTFSSVELCETPKRIEQGSVIYMDAETVGVDANLASTIDIQVSGRNIT